MIGVKVWIFKGEVFDKAELEKQAAEGEAAGGATATGSGPGRRPAAAEAPAQA